MKLVVLVALLALTVPLAAPVAVAASVESSDTTCQSDPAIICQIIMGVLCRVQPRICHVTLA